MIKLDTKSLKQHELFFLIVSIGLGLQVLLAPLEKKLLGNSWLGVVIAVALGLVLSIIYGYWSKYFAYMPWNKVLEYVYGRALGKIILFIYALAFLLISINTLWYLSYFWSSLGLTQTPQAVYILAMLVFIAILAYGGGIVLGRLSVIAISVSALLIILNVVLMLKDVKIINFMPLFQVDYVSLGWIAFSSFLLVFGEMFVLLPLLGDLAAPKTTGKTVLFAVLAIGLVWLLITIRNVGILGESTDLYTFPLMQVLRLTEFGQAISRIEVFGALVLVLIGVVRLGASFIATAVSLQQLWNLPNCKPVIFPLVVLTLALSKGFYNFVTDLMYLMFTIYPIAILLLGVLLPILTIVIGRYKIHRGAPKEVA